MTFIDGAKATKRHKGAGWCAVTVETDVFSCRENVFSERLPSRRADGSLFHTVRPWKLKLRWPVDVSTLSSFTPPVDANRQIVNEDDIITQTTPHDRLGTLSFPMQRAGRNSDRITANEGAKCRWDGENCVFRQSGLFQLRRWTTGNLCPSATMARVDDGVLAERYAMLSTKFDGQISFITLTTHRKVRSHRRHWTKLHWWFVILNTFRTISLQFSWVQSQRSE